MPYPRGAVVAAGDPFGNSSNRPYVVLSNDTHPFGDQEQVAAVVTTTDRSRAVELSDGDYTKGSLPRQSYVSPWNPMTIKDSMVHRHVATVSESVVGDVVDELVSYVR
jgi:mRNA-degrading endonuclease toxin of MazEF toxin-antitoxin module